MPDDEGALADDMLNAIERLAESRGGAEGKQLREVGLFLWGYLIADKPSAIERRLLGQLAEVCHAPKRVDERLARAGALVETYARGGYADRVRAFAERVARETGEPRLLTAIQGSAEARALVEATLAKWVAKKKRGSKTELPTPGVLLALAARFKLWDLPAGRTSALKRIDESLRRSKRKSAP